MTAKLIILPRMLGLTDMPCPLADLEYIFMAILGLLHYCVLLVNCCLEITRYNERNYFLSLSLRSKLNKAKDFHVVWFLCSLQNDLKLKEMGFCRDFITDLESD